jgi:uncharacterized membrane protein YgaE (UPF0421/DUF939 family)
VFVNAILSGIQLRNLEAGSYFFFFGDDDYFGILILLFFFVSLLFQRKWNKPVLDRVSLIIEIFNAHAHTKEAKLQV